MAFVRTAISTNGTLTNGSANITSVANTAGIYVGMCLYGVGIQADTVVNSIAGSTITMSKNATASGSTVITGQYITQSGTDADPSGLSAMTGVTSIVEGTGTRLTAKYNLGLNQLRITGNLTHNPDQYCIVGNVQFAVTIEGIYNYGIEKVVNGRYSYSKGCGLDLTYNGGIASNFPIQLRSGQFNWRGGIIRFGGAFSMTGGLFNQKGDTSVAYNNNSGTQIQLRTILPPSSMVYDKIKLAGDNSTFFWTTQTYSAISANLENGAVQTPAGFSATQTYSDFVFANNQAPADFYINQLSGASSTLSIVKNPDSIPRVAQLNSGAYGVVEIRESLAFNVTDSNNATASNVTAYVKDSNNGARTNENQLTYTSDLDYFGTGTGGLNLGDILVDVQMRNPAATTTVKHDYRGNFGNTSVDFNVYLGGYDYNNAVTKQTLIGNGGKTVGWTLFSDLNISLSRASAIAKLASSFTVDPITKTITVTANSNYDDLYDIAKAYKYNGTKANVLVPTISDLIVDVSGNRLNAYTDWNLVVNSGVTLNVGSKYNEVYFDNITNNGTIVGTYADLTGTYAKILVNGLSSGMVVKVLETSSGNVLSSTIATGTSAYMGYYLPVGATSTTIDLYVERATGQANGYNLYQSTLTVGTSGATTTALMQSDTFYGRSAGQVDRANVSVTWNSTTGAPTITLSGDADVKSVYDVVVESHATIANITYNRPTTSDGFTYEFYNAIFTGTGRLTGTKQFFTTGGVSINYDLILNYLNTVNFLPNSWIKVIKSSDNSVLSPFALNTQGKLELNMGTGVDYKVFLKKDGYKPVVVELNSGTGQAVTVNQPAQAYYNGATDISALTPLLDVTNNSGILSIVSVGEMTATSLEVCAIIDYLQKDEDFADVALYAETGDIWEIISQYQNTPNPTYIKIERDPALTNSELTIWDTYFTSSSPNYPDTAITPIQTSTGLWVISNRSAVGEVTIKNEQALAISENASEYVWAKVLENGKTANKNVSQSNNFDAITSIEVQKTN